MDQLSKFIAHESTDCIFCNNLILKDEEYFVDEKENAICQECWDNQDV